MSSAPARLSHGLGRPARHLTVCFLLHCAAAVAWSQTRTDERPGARFEFTRMIAHWSGYQDAEAYLSFVDDAQPEMAQIGFYGAHFWSLAHTPFYKGYPAHFPVQGLTECGQWFERLNRQLHDRGVTVVGHMNVKFLVGDIDGPEGPRGFFKFYRDLWDEEELGPKPAENPLDLLEKNADGTPIVQAAYSIGKMKEYWGCLVNPQWCAVLKAWTKRGIQRGVDGFIANYFYRHNCLCEHCRRGFRDHLRAKYSPAELRRKFGIDSLERQAFTEIVGWHPPEESTPLRREMLEFSQLANKRAFDEVFCAFGRKLKPGLLAAQWNHLGNFSQISGDERCMLPAEVWGKDEDYLWYSSGASAVFTDLAEGVLGDVTLQMRYIRGAFDDKPFTIGKYEQTRVRVAIAELAANGGAPMGFYTRFDDPEARADIVRYYRFLKRHEAILRANHSHAEAVLLFPRSAVRQGDVEQVERFKEIGQKLGQQHVLFDVRPDDIATPAELSKYRTVLRPPHARNMDSPDLRRLSRFTAPATVRVSASRPAAATDRSLDVHFVNYNRIEPVKKRSPGAGPKDDRPIAVDSIEADLVLPDGARVAAVSAMNPEAPEPRAIPHTVSDGRLRFTMPAFLVYGIAHVEFAPTAKKP